MPTLSNGEMQLLLAEAEWRMGNLAAAATIVNETRVAAGLTALTGNEADFFKWLTYEKKIEAFVRGAGLAFFDRRGWTSTSGEAVGASDLIKDTPLHFPVPAKEQAIGGTLSQDIYTFGGSGSGAGKAIRRTPMSRRIRE